MAATCVVGLQWGDEAKGKIVDFLTEKSVVGVEFIKKGDGKRENKRIDIGFFLISRNKAADLASQPFGIGKCEQRKAVYPASGHNRSDFEVLEYAVRDKAVDPVFNTAYFKRTAERDRRLAAGRRGIFFKRTVIFSSVLTSHADYT